MGIRLDRYLKLKSQNRYAAQIYSVNCVITLTGKQKKEILKLPMSNVVGLCKDALAFVYCLHKKKV